MVPGAEKGASLLAYSCTFQANQENQELNHPIARLKSNCLSVRVKMTGLCPHGIKSEGKYSGIPHCIDIEYGITHHQRVLGLVIGLYVARQHHQEHTATHPEKTNC